MSYSLDGKIKKLNINLQKSYEFRYQKQNFHSLNAKWLAGLDLSYKFKARREPLEKSWKIRQNQKPFVVTRDIKVKHTEPDGLNNPTFYDLMVFEQDFYANIETVELAKFSSLPNDISENKDEPNNRK